MKRLVILLLVIILSGCERQAPHEGLLIAVSIPPQAWFVSQIAGDKAATVILVPPGQNPHNYEPTPRQIQSLASANAWILSGSEFEISLRPKIEALFPDLKIINGTKGVQLRMSKDHEHCDCDSYDRHTWLGMEPAIKLTNHIYDILSLLDAENELFFHEQKVNLISEIEDTFDELRDILAPLQGKSVFVYHPSFGYFLDEFGINQEAVETGGKEPTPRQLSLLVDKMKDEQPAAIFVQTQFPVNAARTIADTIGAQVVELDPLAEDWLENIRLIGYSLQRAVP